MAEVTRAVTWEAPAHHHIEKGHDWFWAIGLVAVAGSVAAFALGNALFGVVILLGAISMIIFGLSTPHMVFFAVTTRGIRIEHELYPFSSLDSFCIDEDHVHGPHLFVKSKKLLMPLIILPIPPEYIDEIDELVGARLPEEELEEPIATRLLEFFGF